MMEIYTKGDDIKIIITDDNKVEECLLELLFLVSNSTLRRILVRFYLNPLQTSSCGINLLKKLWK